MKTLSYIRGEMPDQMSVAEMKRRVYDSVVEFMFNGYEWLHATSISDVSILVARKLSGELISSTALSHHSLHFRTIKLVATRSNMLAKKNFNASPITGKKAPTAKVDPWQEVAKAQQPMMPPSRPINFTGICGVAHLLMIGELQL